MRLVHATAAGLLAIVMLAGCPKPPPGGPPVPVGPPPPAPIAAGPRREPPLPPAERIEAAIERGVQFILALQGPEGDWESADAVPIPHGCQTAAILRVLLQADVSPNDPRVEKAIEWVDQLDSDTVLFRAMRAGLGDGRPPTRRKEIAHRDLAWLLNAAHKDGTFGPLPSQARGAAPDVMHTALVVIALGELADQGLEIPDRFWRLSGAALVKARNAEGGWPVGIGRGGPSRQATTLAALTALYTIWDQSSWTRPAPDPEIAQAIQSGLAWLGRNFEPSGEPGGPNDPLASDLAHVLLLAGQLGWASGVGRFGDRDWWRTGARLLVPAQDHPSLLSGAFGWRLARPGDPSNASPLATAWAVRFLADSRAPIAIGRLAYGEGDGWNAHPRAAARLTRFLSLIYAQRVGWRIVSIDGPVEALGQAPVLVMSGREAINLNAAEKARLREYVLGGGLLLGVATGGSPAFADSFRALGGELLPDLQWAALPADHRIYSAQFPLEPGLERLPRLEGIDNGVRALVVLSGADLGETWQRYSLVTDRRRFEMAANLWRYAEGLDRFRMPMGESILVADLGHSPARTITVGRCVWGANRQHDPEPNAWVRTDVLLRNADLLGVKTVEVDFTRPVAVEDVPVVHLTGVGRLRLGNVQQRNLKDYVQEGGLLVMDPAGGDRDFADSSQNLLERMFEGLEPAQPPFLNLATEQGRVWLRDIECQPRSLRPITLSGWQCGPGEWGVLALPYDLTAALAGVRTMGVSGLTIESADRFIAALLTWKAGLAP